MDHLDNMGDILERWRMEEKIQDGSFADMMSVSSSLAQCTLHEKGGEDPSKPKNIWTRTPCEANAGNRKRNKKLRGGLA